MQAATAEGMTREPNSRERKKRANLASELVKYPELRGTHNDAQPAQYNGEVKILDNSPSSTGSDVTQAFFLEDWPKLLATIPNLKIFVATVERKLHAKVGVIDDQVSLVSSFNLDFLSSKVNSYCNVHTIV